MAWYHAKSFPVKHGLWGAYYLAAAYLATWLFTRSFIISFTPISFEWIPLVVFLSLIAVRKPTFDLPLNLFRKKGLWYISLSTDSIIDKFLIRTFKVRTEEDIRRMYGAFTLLWIVLLIIYYLLNGRK